MIKSTFVLDDGRHLPNGNGWASKPAVTADYFRVIELDFSKVARLPTRPRIRTGVVIVSATIAKRCSQDRRRRPRISMEDHPT